MITLIEMYPFYVHSKLMLVKDITTQEFSTEWWYAN